jgi:pimeloyl-ACP methyl ester carboxylesterase/alkylhydroperoxidase family enzyme
LVPRLASDFRVLRYDLRGAGLSEKPRRAFSFADHVKDLSNLLAALGLHGPVHIVGVAAGAAIAVSFALDHSDRVGSLVLCAPALSVDQDRVHYLVQRSDLAIREGMVAVCGDTLDRSYPPVVRRDQTAHLNYRGRFLANDPVGHAHSNLAFAEVDLVARLTELNAPCLVLAGIHDLLRPQDKLRRLAQIIRGAEFALIDSGHLVPVQAPAEMARRLHAFFSDAANVTAPVPGAATATSGMRIKDLSIDEMNEAQRAVAAEATSGKRGRVPAPLRAWLHSPELGRRAQRLGEFVRYETSLPPELSEIAILVTARFWTSHYEWYAHKREGLKAGIEAAVIDAIARRATPDFDLADRKAALVHDYAKILLAMGRVPEDLHAAAVEQLGEQSVVELVGILGYYSLVALTLNAFEIGLPEGEMPELQF